MQGILFLYKVAILLLLQLQKKKYVRIIEYI